MKKLRSLKLHVSTAQRLALRFSLLIAVIILLLSVSLVLLLRYNVRMRQDKMLVSSMERIASIFSNVSDSRLPPFSDHPDSPPGKLSPGPGPGPGPNHLPFTAELPYYLSFTVYRAGSDTILETNDPFLPQLPLTDGHTRRYTRKNYFTDGDLNILYGAKQYGSTIPGAVIVQTALNMDQDTAEQLLSGMPRILLFAFLPLLFISYWAAFLITKRTMKPVLQMTKAAQKIGSANLDQSLPLTGQGDELDVLAVTFNELFARLKTDFDRERQFTADVSHELKTPLAVILGHANLIRRWGKNDPVQLEKSLDLLIGEVHSMESVITNLLQLARLENGQIKLDFHKVPLVPLLRRLAEDTVVWAPGVRISVRVDREFSVRADEELLYQAFTIIVSNSVKFAGDKAAITITASYGNTPGTVSIVISDNGPGIKKESLPHIFERFYRGDPSHNRKTGGSGLGLAIVRTIMMISCGTVSARSELGRGTDIVLELPEAGMSD